MCDHASARKTALPMMKALSTVFPSSNPLLQHTAAEPGREVARRPRTLRLWELPSSTHCPLIGVCLPIPVLRRLIEKALGSRPPANDYDFHVAAVAECGRRTPISEALQRELDRRFAPTIRDHAKARTSEALVALWHEALQGPGVAGALWATLTHRCCDASLRERVCRDIHMLQHQVGACNRADLQRLEQLQDEQATLTRELSRVRLRHAQALKRRTEQMERLNIELMQVRGQLIGRDSMVAGLREELDELKAVMPDLQTRTDLARRLELQCHRIHELERSRTLWRQQAEQEAARARALAEDIETLRDASARPAPVVATGAASTPADLREKAVLCVGGRPASVPSYRQLIEYKGGRFLHHDGGEEDSAAQLDASLAAADLVICQTGCISHGAYWRVKDYCKRTGKRCVFVDKPSASSFERCLRGLAEVGTVEG